jgi:chaperone BCS1
VKKCEGLLDLEKLSQWFFREDLPEEHKRFITYSTSRNHWGYTSNIDHDSENWVLHKAIKLYVHHVLQLKLKTGNLNLMEGEFGKSKDDDEDDIPRRTLFGILLGYNVVNTIPNNHWYNLGEYGNPTSQVRMCIETNEQKEGDDEKTSTKTNSITFQFRSMGEGAIEAFVDEAYKWYLEELRKQEDHSRYLYEMKVPDLLVGSGDEGRSSSSSNIRYKRYKLSNEKTFESLFFRQKGTLLSIVDHFIAKSGKYDVSGYPYKLGLLLHGPPGTGKTSLSK